MTTPESVRRYIEDSRGVDVTISENGITTVVATSKVGRFMEDTQGPDDIESTLAPKNKMDMVAPLNGVVTMVPYSGTESSQVELPRTIELPTNEDRRNLPA